MVIPMQEEIVGNSRTMLLMLLGAVGLVLLIACANVGNLLFTRALSRRKEIAIRSALGAGRGRVFQQLLTEALLLAGAGGALGLLLAYGTLTSASTLLAGQVPRAEEISIDGRVLLFAVGVSMLTGMLAGTLPAVRAGRSDLAIDALKEGGRGDGAIGVGTRRLLIVCEVALSLVLLMGAGVMIQSLLALRYGDTGFDPNNVLTMDVRLVDARYPSPAQRSSFFDAALQRIRALPGVEAAGTIDDLPFADGSSQTLELEGYAPQRDPVAVQVRQITPATCGPWGFRCCVDATSSRATRRCCWSARTPRSCIGEQTIRSDAVQPCQPFRRRSFGRWSESWGTSSSGISLKPPRPRCTSTRASLMAGQRSPYGHRCRPPRSHSLPSQRSARSIQSSRSQISGRWCRCSTEN